MIISGNIKKILRKNPHISRFHLSRKSNQATLKDKKSVVKNHLDDCEYYASKSEVKDKSREDICMNLDYEKFQ
jgi:hypothetical protein